MNKNKVYNECIKKKSYRTVEYAKKVAAKVLEKRGTVLHCYHCLHCLGYHLTSMENYIGDNTRMF